MLYGGDVILGIKLPVVFFQLSSLVKEIDDDDKPPIINRPKTSFISIEPVDFIGNIAKVLMELKGLVDRKMLQKPKNCKNEAVIEKFVSRFLG